MSAFQSIMEQYLNTKRNSENISGIQTMLCHWNDGLCESVNKDPKRFGFNIQYSASKLQQLSDFICWREAMADTFQAINYLPGVSDKFIEGQARFEKKFN